MMPCCDWLIVMVSQNLFGLLEVRGICSGYAIGSCNWLISSKYEKVGAFRVRG